MQAIDEVARRRAQAPVCPEDVAWTSPPFKSTANMLHGQQPSWLVAPADSTLSPTAQDSHWPPGHRTLYVLCATSRSPPVSSHTRLSL